MKNLSINKSTKTKKYFHGIALKAPTKQEFDKYIEIWNEKYDNEFNDYNHELVLDCVFVDYNNSNKAIKEMYIKCVLLDKLYGTNIKYMDGLIKHLSSIENFEQMLQSGNPELVNIMKRVKKDNNKVINYLSFASKYCRRYNPTAFPIYDSIVKDILKYYMHTTNFYIGNKVDFNDYCQYKNVVDQFIKAHPFVENYVMLDRYLWTMGKEKINGISLVNKIREAKNAQKLNYIAKQIGAKENLSAEELEDFVVHKFDL